MNTGKIVRCRLCSRLVKSTHAAHLRHCGRGRGKALGRVETESQGPDGSPRRTLVRTNDRARRIAAKKAKNVRPKTIRF